MWFVGLVLGLCIGASVGDFKGAVVGAIIGLALGFWLRQLMRRQDAVAAEGEMGRRLSTLETRLHALEQRLETIERSDVRHPQVAADAAAPGPLSEPPQPAAAEELATSHDAVILAQTPLPAVASVSAVEPTPAAARVLRPAPKPPREPSFIWRWFMGGNTVVRVGVVVLFFGIAFLLKYAYEHTHVPIELRLTGVCVAAIVLLIIGWRLRLRRPGYALALQGGGIGVFYLTVFAAFRLYHVLPPEAALVLLFFIAALSAALAVLQDAQSLAALGASGGFLAPILASTGGGSHVMLFSYYAMLNFGILGIAWFKAWRPLNVLGFAFTFGIGTLWGTHYYQPELFSSTEPFLVLFFAMYLAIPILFARRRAPELKSYVDGTLVFGTPLVAFGLQTQLTRNVEYGAAWSAVALSLVYLLIARWLFVRQRDNQRLLVEAFLALGVIFATLAIPLALDGRWTSATWALEGAAIVWTGVRQDRRLARAFGLFLQLAAGFAFLFAFDRGRGDVPVLNSFYLGCLFISVAGFFCNWYLERKLDRVHAIELALAKAVFVWALLWWAAGGLHEIEVRIATPDQNHVVLLFATASSLLFSLLYTRISWPHARFPALALLPVMIVLALVDAAEQTHPLARIGAVAWPAAFAIHLWILRRHDQVQHRYLDFLHAGQLLLLCALCSWELNWNINQAVQASPVWGHIAWAFVPAAVLALLSAQAERLPWPVRSHIPTYMTAAGAPLAIYLCAWIVFANAASDGNASPLPYVPLLNPLDLAQIAALLCTVTWLRGLKRLDIADYAADSPLLIYGLIGAVAFIGLNGALLRALHHLASVPYRLDTMLSSMLVQAALSIFWSILALCAMVVATRMRARPLWIAGASLMGVVVVKLFLLDLSSISGIERIVSFIGVGVLMLVIGYLSPVPPRAQEQSQ
jgi:uncharacterized membrane protein